MPGDSSEEKTEQATPRRKEEARKKGNVPKSIELNYALGFLTAIFSLYFFMNYIYLNLKNVFIHFFSDFSYEITVPNVVSLFVFILKNVAFMLFPIIIALVAIALFSNIIQTGFISSEDALKPQFNRINPIEGFKKLFSLKGIVELIKSILKIFAIGYIVYWTIRTGYENYVLLVYAPVNTIIVFLLKLSYKVAFRAGIAMIIIGIFDFAYQKWQHGKDLMMTKQEVKEEYKNTEGDPQVKSRIRALQREMASRRMMESVPEADVVITNPTHYAIAIKYDEQESDAPIVIAKGKLFIAQKIKEIARDNGVPIMENPPLARALFASVEIGEEIPEEYYTAVAEILAYVYSLNKKKGFV